ncbi:MAG: hypothetical protein ABSA49_11755, partial [Rhizomicrobium sp.]
MKSRAELSGVPGKKGPRPKIVNKARLRLQQFARLRCLPIGNSAEAQKSYAEAVDGRLKTAEAVQAAAAAPAPPGRALNAAVQTWRWLGPSEITNGQTMGND